MTTVGRIVVIVFLTAIVALSSCGPVSSLDFDVFVEVTSATIEVETSFPSELAEIECAIAVYGGKRTSDSAELSKVVLYESDAVMEFENEYIRLNLAIPDSVDTHVSGSDLVSFSLVNTGTTNGDLAPLCGNSYNLVAWIFRSKEKNQFHSSSPFPVEIVCR